MADNVLEVADQVRRRLNRGTEVDQDDILAWLSWAKRDAMLGSPYDFMWHRWIAVAGSGQAIPGQTAGGLSGKLQQHLLVPKEVRGIKRATALLGRILTAEELDAIFGHGLIHRTIDQLGGHSIDSYAGTTMDGLYRFPGAHPACWYCPTSCASSSDFLTTGHVTDEFDLYPYVGGDEAFLVAELAARGIFVDMDRARATSVPVRLGTEAGATWISTVDLRADSERMGMVQSGSQNPADPTDAMQTEGYGVGPFQGFSVDLSDVYAAYPEIAAGSFLVELEGWMAPGDYGKPDLRKLGGPSLLADIFTAEAEALLVTGALKWSYFYLEDDGRASRYGDMQSQEIGKFRLRHNAIRHHHALEDRRRPFGSPVRRWREG